MNINQISSILLLSTFSLMQCMEITPVEKKAVSDDHLQKLISNANKVSLNIVNIVKEHSRAMQQELTPENISLVLNLNKKQIDDIFLATVQDDDLRQLLFSMGADIKARTQDGRNCLWYIKDEKLLTELLDKGAEVDVIDTKGNSPLSNLLSSLFANKQEFAAARIILAHSTNDEMKQKNYGLLFHDIMDYKYTELRLEAAKLLCDHGINVNILKSSSDCSILIKSIRQGSADLVELFLQNGADKDINTQNYYDEYPLHVAMEKEDHHYYSRTRILVPKIVLLLLQYGAKPNIAYSDGLTMPLHVAVDRDQPIIIQELIKKGADKSCTNKKGLTAYDLAKQRNYKQDILDMLYVPSPLKENVVHDEKGEPVVIINPESGSSENNSSNSNNCCIQ